MLSVAPEAGFRRISNRIAAISTSSPDGAVLPLLAAPAAACTALERGRPRFATGATTAIAPADDDPWTSVERVRVRFLLLASAAADVSEASVFGANATVALGLARAERFESGDGSSFAAGVAAMDSTVAVVAADAARTAAPVGAAGPLALLTGTATVTTAAAETGFDTEVLLAELVTGVKADRNPVCVPLILRSGVELTAVAVAADMTPLVAVETAAPPTVIGGTEERSV